MNIAVWAFIIAGCLALAALPFAGWKVKSAAVRLVFAWPRPIHLLRRWAQEGGEYLVLKCEDEDVMRVHSRGPVLTRYWAGSELWMLFVLGVLVATQELDHENNPRPLRAWPFNRLL